MSKPALICPSIPPVSSPTPIALCITDLDPGGAEKALVQVVTRLDRSQWAPVVYCLGRRGALADQLEAHSIETHSLDAGRRDLLVVTRLAKRLRQRPPALIQTFLFHGNLAGRLAALIAGVPLVVSGVRVAERDKRWHVRLERWTKRLVTHHVCVSPSVADFTRRELRLQQDAVSVIPNGVDSAAISSASPADLSQFGIPGNARTLLFVGRLDVQKGISVLLDAFRALALGHPDLHLLVVGAGPLEAGIRQFVRAHGLDRTIHLAGRRDDVPSLMRSAQALVLPSLWEGMPNVVLEAMAAGLPVVATAVDGTADVVTDRVTGWLCPPGSADALSQRVSDCLAAPEQAVSVAKAAQVSVKERFAWISVAASYQRLWLELIDRRGRN
ncbi:2-deoxystreptamine glucosyltransferase [Caulifigura coniformis]|uniref:2-deoxystreptamine glucosyltransferase n=1 Tax=Caulifigura coniformis TaxID=2527983 RepID=A0A517SK37_9PLAN|nr:glycosyltransferase [Caulifigura coniformis]QDT56488.1 2-deoxystreptamine glucosyltransferase [Caulifigura coniformis]